MNEAKPSPDPRDYHEGKDATERFLQGVKSVLSTSPAELKKKHEQWEKARKAAHKKSG